MNKCDNCGRENGGHWIGCERAKRPAPVSRPAPEHCTFGECTEPRWSDHPRAQFCVDHKDAKSREK